jgi:hypothetical protein
MKKLSAIPCTMKTLFRLSLITASCFALSMLNANANSINNGSFELGSFVNQGNETMSLSHRFHKYQNVLSGL